jgi:ribosomal protein S18 acetylase RimI-like enzyme
LARLLAERLVEEAKRRGYRTMRLDTADTMLPAQRLYQALGFRPTDPYYEGPPEIMARALFMERDLGSRSDGLADQGGAL